LTTRLIQQLIQLENTKLIDFYDLCTTIKELLKYLQMLESFVGTSLGQWAASWPAVEWDENFLDV